MVCSLSLQALVCKQLEGETKYILIADRTMTCGSSAVIWLVQLSGAASFLGILLARNLIELREDSDLGQRTCSLFVCAVLAIVYPLMITARVFAYNRDGRLDDERVLGKYGHFFTGGCAVPNLAIHLLRSLVPPSAYLCQIQITSVPTGDSTSSRFSIGLRTSHSRCLQ